MKEPKPRSAVEIARWVEYNLIYKPQLFDRNDEASAIAREYPPAGDPLINEILKLPKNTSERWSVWRLSEYARKGSFLDLNELKRARSILPGWARLVFNKNIRHIEQHGQDALEHLGLPARVLAFFHDDPKVQIRTIAQLRSLLDELNSLPKSRRLAIERRRKEIDTLIERLAVFDKLLAEQSKK